MLHAQRRMAPVKCPICSLDFTKAGLSTALLLQRINHHIDAVHGEGLGDSRTDPPSNKRRRSPEAKPRATAAPPPSQRELEVVLVSESDTEDGEFEADGGVEEFERVVSASESLVSEAHAVAKQALEVQAPPDDPRPAGGVGLHRYFGGDGADVLTVRWTEGGKNPTWKRLRVSELRERGYPVTVVTDFLPTELADNLLRLLVEQSKAWKHWERHVAGRLITPKYLSKVIYDVRLEGQKEEEGCGSLSQHKYMQETSALIAQYVNKAGEANGRRTDEDWKATFLICNLYRNGKDMLQAHSDDLGRMGPMPTIVGLTLGARRMFRIRPYVNGTPAANPKLDLYLPHNSIVIMWPGCQEHYVHEVPPMDEVELKAHPIGGLRRFSITFRHNRPHKIPNCHCGTHAMLQYVRTGRHEGQYRWICDRSMRPEEEKCNLYLPYFARPAAVRDVAEGSAETCGK